MRSLFIFEIIEICDSSLLDEREKYWISFYNSFYDGYNRTKGGQNQYCGHPKLTKEDVEHIRIAYNLHEEKENVYNKLAGEIIGKYDIVSYFSNFYKFNGTYYKPLSEIELERIIHFEVNENTIELGLLYAFTGAYVSLHLFPFLVLIFSVAIFTSEV